VSADTRDAGCGGRITASSGVIRSPSFPDWYPPYRDCYWTVITQPGKYIEFTIGFLEIESSANCTKDYLEVSDGLRINLRINVNLYTASIISLRHLLC